MITLNYTHSRSTSNNNSPSLTWPPSSIEVLDPYSSKETKKIVSEFYNKFYSDNNNRIICFGINPGRFGGGITGIPFTDPYFLEKNCDINSTYMKKKEIEINVIIGNKNTSATVWTCDLTSRYVEINGDYRS